MKDWNHFTIKLGFWFEVKVVKDGRGEVSDMELAAERFRLGLGLVG